MENQRDTKYNNSESRRQSAWEKPVVKAEYNVADLTKMIGGGPGAADGPIYS